MPPKQAPAPPLTKQTSATKKPPAQTPQKITPKSVSKPPLSSNSTPQPQIDSSQPSKARRKPRKLTRPSNPQNAPPTTSTTTSPDPLALTTEITALKSRMVSLESQVSTLYTATASLTSSPAPAGPAKLPRRRGRGRGNAAPIPGAEEKVRKLEAEIEGVGREVGMLERRRDEQQLQKSKTGEIIQDGLGIENGVLEEDEDVVEEIPRLDEPRIDRPTQPGQKERAVTLTGSYRIPLPATVSMDDVRTIQRGVSSANRIARGVLEGARGQGDTLSRGRTRNGSESWSEWIGGYSMSVARFVNSIEADAAVAQGQQQQKETAKSRPGAGARRRTAPISASQGSSPTSPTQNAPKRPPARPRGSSSRLSQQEVETLMA